jgi:hypothetical protein
MEEIKVLWLEYYPVVVAGLIALGGFLGTIYLVYTQVDKLVTPILDKIKVFRSEDDEKALSGIEVDDIKMEVLKADLLAKIANPTISPELTLLYQVQLDRLESMTTTTTATLDTLEETVNKYT